jgi:hypothetical protein
MLRRKGYSNAAAAGVIGNLQQESGVDPNSNQHGGGPGRGIAQWTNTERWATLTKWAGKSGKNPRSLQTQVDFLDKEMDQMSFTPRFKKMTDVSAATILFEKKFERAGIPNYANRIREANKAYANYAGGVRAPTPGASKGPPLGGRGPNTQGKPPAPGKPGKKAPSGLAALGDNLVPDNLGDLGDAITPDNLPNPLSGVEAIGDSANKITTQLFSVSFWIRAAFILVGISLVFIGTKALLSGNAPAAPSTPSMGGPPMQTNSAGPPKKPFGAKVKSGIKTAAVVMPK